jgi:hypothetical protein
MVAIIDEQTATVIVAAVGLLGTWVAAYYAYRGKAEAKAANQAVNNTGPGEHRLYDMVQKNHDNIIRQEVRNQAAHESIMGRLNASTDEGSKQRAKLSLRMDELSARATEERQKVHNRLDEIETTLKGSSDSE